MKKVVIGMSGGVDSSVAAYLLKEQGYDVIGVTMQIWQDEDLCSLEAQGGCCGLSAVDDARRVASHIDIPYYVMNFKEEFKDNVIDYFVTEYLQARTPNPCIACNRYVKWESLLKRSLDIGADYIATGHYARVIKLNNGRYTIRKSLTAAKDQTYALYNLTQYQLSHTLMPVGEFEKDEIRKMAHEWNLPVADKPDSQEICFIPDNNYSGFISDYLEDPDNKKIVEDINKRNTVNTIYANNGLTPGNFINTEGEIIGKHSGLMNYTIGQRKGLNLALGYPVFVTELKQDTNEVVIGKSNEVYSDSLYANQLNFMSIEDLDGEMEVEAKIRYGHKGATCTIIKIDNDTIFCKFKKAQRAITPGQAVVFYQNDYVLGGGTIIKK